MNYRHAFHAGNFADVFKHAVLLRWLEALTADARPLELLDTHAGAGVYDLAGADARRSGEAAAGIGRVLAAPAPSLLRPLAERVRAVATGAQETLYPGSPVLAAGALRPGDAYVGWEARPEVCDALALALRTFRGPADARAERGDGYAAAETAAPGVRRAVLIDPPFESPDEVVRLVRALQAVLARGEPALVWTPLKDLDGFDRLVGRVEALRPPAGSTAVQVRLRPLVDPLRLNGCALLLLGGFDVSEAAQDAARAVASLCGGPGACAVVDRLG